MKSKLMQLLLTVASTCAPMSVHAVPMTWYVSGTFDDAGTLAGWFTLDPDGCSTLELPTAVDISTTAGTTLGVGSYQTSFAVFHAACVADEYIGIAILGVDTLLALNFDGGLPSVGGSLGLKTSSFERIVGTDETRYLTAGTLSTTTPSVPEPGTLVLIGLGLAGLAFARRRRAVG